VRRLLVSRLWLPPLFRVQSPAERALNLALPPLVWGLLCGALSSVNRLSFTVGLALSVLGAFGAGRQQLGLGSGLLRGILAGTLFGASVLTGQAIAGTDSTLFHPAWLQVVFTAVVGGTFASCGGWSR
jgi:hypothetical protein